MLAALGLLTIGAVVVYAGAEAAIRGAVGGARVLGISAFVVGAVLFGVDLEGLGTAVAGAARGETELAAGEIFGTVLFLFSAAFGAALLVARRPIPAPSPLMVLAPAIPLIACAMVLADRTVERLEAVLLVLLYAVYLGLVVLEGELAKRRADELESEADEAPTRTAALIGIGALGLVLLAGGSALLIGGGTRLAAELGLSEGFVGAAILGVLVSLDEVLLEVLPVRRGAPELATGNLLGTLAAFCSGVLGIAALVRPIVIDSAAAVAFLGAAFLYALVATAFLWRGRAGRLIGVFVLGFYAAWLVVAADF